MSTPAGEVVSALPGSMQRKLAALQAAAETPTDTPTPATPTPPATPAVAAPTPVTGEPAAPSGGDEGDRITLTRAELNELRAAADRARTADGRAQAQADRNEELSRRLTELEAAAKATPTPAAPSAPTTEAEEFTAEELEAYSESRTFIAKVVRQELAKVLPTITAQLDEVRNTAKAATSTVQQQSSRSFFAELKAKVPNLDNIIKHKHWADFLDAEDDMSGATYGALIQHHVTNQKLEALANVYKKFATLYGVEAAPATNGYAGAVPSGGAASVPQPPAKPVKLKASDRKKASEDYRKGKITWAQLEEVNKQFEIADKAGNVDYNA